MNHPTFISILILNFPSRYYSPYSDTVGSIMHQERKEIRKVKGTKSFRPLIKPIIPIKAGKTMNSAEKKNYSISEAYLKAKINHCFPRAQLRFF